MTKPRKINAEPFLFLISFAFGLYSTIHTAFITFKQCLWLLDSSVNPLPNPHDYCQRLGSNSGPKHNANFSTSVFDQAAFYNYSDSQFNNTSQTAYFAEDPDLAFLNKVQAATARFSIYSEITGTVPTVLVTIFIGAWSDANGRKTPLIIAQAGTAIAAQISTAIAAVDSIPVYVMLAPTFVMGLTGQLLVVTGCTFAMISDAAMSSKDLTIRIAVASGVSSVGSLSGHLISAVLLQYWDNFTLIYLCGGICKCVAFVYAVFGLQETIQFSRRREREASEGDQHHPADEPQHRHEDADIIVGSSSESEIGATNGYASADRLTRNAFANNGSVAGNGAVGFEGDSSWSGSPFRNGPLMPDSNTVETTGTMDNFLDSSTVLSPDLAAGVISRDSVGSSASNSLANKIAALDPTLPNDSHGAGRDSAQTHIADTIVPGSNDSGLTSGQPVTNGASNGHVPENQSGHKAFLHVNRVKELLGILTKPRPGRRRFYLLTTLVSFAFLFSIQPQSITNLFAKRPPLSFTNSEYSYLTATGSAMMFAPAVFTWLLKTSDISLIVLGIAFGVFRMAMTAFSTQKWMLFTATTVGGLSTLEFTGFRSFMTNLVEPTEAGRLFATVGTIDHLAPLLSSSIFNNIYAMTLEWFPGFVFLLSAGLTFLILLVMSYLYLDIKKYNQDLAHSRRRAIIDDCDTEALIHSEIEG